MVETTRATDQTTKGLKMGAQEESKRGVSLQTTSLMLVQNSYDHRVEKLDLIEKRKKQQEKSRRKVFQDYETFVELQDMYRINEESQLSSVGRNDVKNFGRATHNREMQLTKMRVCLQPRVYPQRNFDDSVQKHSDSIKAYDVRNHLNSTLNLFKTVPYASAKLFYCIAANKLQVSPEQSRNGPCIEQSKCAIRPV